ncbi:MAG: transporter [Lutibacter sp.]|nr:MAG: transporter [Lutibacter sp.]
MKSKIYTSILIVLFSLQLNAQEVLTKKEALQLALENNYGIKLANNNVKIAENNSSIYNSRYLPTASFNAGANYNNSNFDISNHDGTSNSINGAETKTYNASINANYVIFDGLGRKYNYKQLKETHNLSELQAKETIENTYLQLFNVYYQIARLTENTTNLKEALSITKQRLQRAKYQYDYGQANKLEVLNAEVDINNDSINLINANQQVKNAKRDLNLILNKEDQDLNYNVDTQVDFNDLLNYEGLLIKAKENNTIIKQTDQNIAISELNLKINKANFLPTVGLSSSYGWNKSDNPVTSFQAGSEVTGLNAGLNLSWNIFDGGNTKTRVNNAKIAIENQQLIKQQQTANLETTLQNTWDAYQNQLYILKAQEQNVFTAQNNFERTEERFKIGQVSSVEFRQAQINLLNSKTAVNNAKYDAKLIEIELLQLSGQLLDVEF